MSPPHNSTMHSFEATLERGNSYSVTIGYDIENETVEILRRAARSSRIAIIADTTTEKICRDGLMNKISSSGLSAGLYKFEPGEINKTQNEVTKLQHTLLDENYDRDTLIVAFGGGVVGDLVGFVAATYMRGLRWVNIPTTVLAMVDSSIGGKVGIDTRQGKNMIGAFWPPCAVIMDLKYLEKLTSREIINGLFEAVKTFLTSDANALMRALSLDLQKPLEDHALLEDIIYTSAKFKAELTKRDPREENERRVLNFGHTVGHALELCSNYTLPHGYAVAYGILVEAKISELSGILSSTDCSEVFRTLAYFGIKPTDFPKYPIEKIIEATKGDKKMRGGIPHYVLLESIGSVYKKEGQFAHAIEDIVVKKALISLTK